MFPSKLSCGTRSKDFPVIKLFQFPTFKMSATHNHKWTYPVAEADTKAKTTFSHGPTVPNPFEWLENLNSNRVHDFISGQKTLSNDYLSTCKELNEIKTAFKNVSNIPSRKMSCPTESVGKRFFFMNDETCPGKDSLYIQESSSSHPQVFLSPEEIPGSGKKKSLFLRMYSVSMNCETVAYAFSSGKNSEWMSIRFKQVKTGKDYDEELKNVCKSDISWTHDNQGILYSCFPQPLKQLNHKIAFHRPGTNQLDDIVLVEFPTNPFVTLQAEISDSGNLLFVYALENNPPDSGSGPNNFHFFYGDLTPSIETDYQWTPLLYHLFEGEHLDIQYITNDSSFTYFRTNIHAPHFRIVKCRLFHKNILTRTYWETIVKDDRKRLLTWAKCVNKDYLMICYLDNGSHTLQLHKLHDGTFLHKYSLPIGTITDYYGDRWGSRFFFTFSSFLIPDRSHCITVRRQRHGHHHSPGICSRLLKRGNRRIETIHCNRDLEKALDLSGYRVKQKYCKSRKDGVSIPLFVMHKRGMRMNGAAPCMVYGQGCFGVQVLPSFSVAKAMFLKHFHGVIAIVGTRGGGEGGQEWYHEGSLFKKQTTYDDLISAVEFLIKSGYTSPSKLILEGELFGGNLAGVCLTQRPDLFNAVIIHDGLLDMLNFEKFPESKSWKSEFGDPEDSPLFFQFLEKLSPLHNIPTERSILRHFPAVMLTIGTEPCLAHPSDSLKFIAQLQQILTSSEFGTKPAILRVEGATGSRNERTRRIDERAEIFAFVVLSLGLKFIP